MVGKTLTDRSLDHRLCQKEHIGRTGARHGGDSIKEVLGQLQSLADCAEQNRCAFDIDLAC